MRPDLYISGDVETDGPIPGPYSMLSLGLTVVGSFDGATFERAEPGQTSLYRELKPISDAFEPEALAVNGLDRDRLKREGLEPREAMDQAFEWVQGISADRRPVLVAYPLAFDWTWLYWYFVRFAKGGSPFGFSGCLDVKTMIATTTQVPFDRANKENTRFASSERVHTHHALDDAIEQGELFCNVFSSNLEHGVGRPSPEALDRHEG